MTTDPRNCAYARFDRAFETEDTGPRLFNILLNYGDEIVVAINYYDEVLVRELPGARLVCLYDLDGNALMRVPTLCVTEWLTEDEAAQLDSMWQADMQLLSYAR